MGEDKQPSPKRTPVKRPSAKRAAPEQAILEKDSIDRMVEALAKVAENARAANAAEPTVDAARRAGGRLDESAWWPPRLRRRARTS